MLPWSWNVLYWLDREIIQYAGRTLFKEAKLTMARGRGRGLHGVQVLTPPPPPPLRADLWPTAWQPVGQSTYDCLADWLPGYSG